MGGEVDGDVVHEDGERRAAGLDYRDSARAVPRRRVQKKRIGSLCRGGVALPRLIFVFFVGDMSPSSMPPSKSKPSTPSGDGPMKLGDGRTLTAGR